ncbi:glycosyltransferase [Nodularia spumigena]|uniref:glycosyltransferase n=1 Tax=Nodularia spumigena TaxID=70799 RepID=UPI00232FD249|nr:glycosyltransferase [Nodularia spumigena]MDB9347416.1 glycosyltransferase [Nodularia spumigena CS-588/01]MDB9354462.1 glycosyltransferase [Nodularia spumigena CS-588/05]
MRILITADPELPVPPKLYGGIERIIDSLVKELQKRGHTIALVAHPESTTPANQFFPWSGNSSQNKWDSIRNTLTLWLTVQNFKPDIIHSFSRILYLLPLLKSPLPKIMSYQRQPSYKSIQWATKLVRKSLIFTGCSQHICKQGEMTGGNWHPIFNFVELNKYTFQPTVSSDAPLVFLSRVESIKGAHLAIEIAQRTGKNLLIAGNYSNSGQEGEYWKSQILPHLGKNGIEYVGTVNDQQKDELLGKALAMIVPIQWDEPFGIVFAEALACGTPVISCPRGALPEIVRQGIDGFLIESIEEGCKAVENIYKLDRLNCRNRVENCFSADIIVEQYEKLYLKLLIKEVKN